MDGAERLAGEAVEALDRAVGPTHPDAANARCTLARVALIGARFAEAAGHAREAFAALATSPPDPVIDMIRLGALEQLGAACIPLGAYGEAEEALASALALATGEGQEDASRAPGVQNARGMLFKFLGRYDDAQAAYDDARARYEAAGIAVPAALFHNFAGLACARGDFAAAEALVRRGIERRREDEGDGFGLAQDLAGLADALSGQARYAEAEALYEDALARFRALAPAHPEIGYALHNLADALADAGRDDDAAVRYREAITLKTRAFGAGHHEVAASEANLAALLAPRFPEEARALAARARASTAGLAPSHPVRVGCEALAARLGA